MTGLAYASRALVAVGLLALLVFGLPGGPAPGEPLLLNSATPPDTVAAILARDTAPTLSWVDTLPPGRKITALLSAAARGPGVVTLALPDRAGRIRVEAPDRPVAGRRAALRVSVRGEPATEVPVTVEGTGGRVDTVGIVTGPDGRGSVSLGVEANREGTASWTARSPYGAAVAHAWARPASPVRVLVWGGAPGSESRYLVRALEAAGVEVEVRQELGRGLAVTSPEVTVPRTLDDLGGYDVVAFIGAPPEAVGALALRWVRERGGGLLLAGGLASSSPLSRWAPSGTAVDGSAADIEWEGPAEIVPLPGAEIVTRARRLPRFGGGPGGVPVARLDGDPIAHVVHLGRGRLFSAAFESWPWVMRAGLTAEHRAFWESVVEWLAGGLRGETVLVAEPANVGARWDGRFEGQAPSEVLLSRDPPGAAAVEALSILDREDGTARVALVPTRAGVHGLRSASGTTPAETVTFGVVAVDPAEGLTWTASAHSIGRGGGRIVSADGLGPTAGSPDGDRGEVPPVGSRAPGRRLGLSWLLLIALAGITVLGWTLRRIQGLP